MADQNEIIYYVSQDLIDQLYRNRFGPLEEKVVTSTDESTKAGTAKVGLGKLLSFLGIVSEIEIKGDTKSGKSVESKRVESVVDRALVLLRRAIEEKEALSLAQLNDSSQLSPVYLFDGLIKLDYKRLPGHGKEYFIQVTCKSENAVAVGVTSKNNWASESLRTNLLLQSAGSQGVGIPASCLIAPLSVDRTKNPVRLAVQFLFIFSHAR